MNSTLPARLAAFTECVTCGKPIRHRYEVNNDYREVLEANGMSLCGLSPDSRIVEMVEIPSHPWFIATQAHPELKSRPNRPHPLFKGFVEAALAKQHEKEN